MDVDMDATGRVLISPSCAAAGISKDTMLLGMGNHFELWDKATYDEQEAKAMQGRDAGCLQGLFLLRARCDISLATHHRPAERGCRLLLGAARAQTGTWVDATFGRGGTAPHPAPAGPQGRLVAFDKDPEAIAEATRITDARFSIRHEGFRHLADLPPASAAGVLMDLGVSSPQIDNPSGASVSVLTVRWTCAWTPRAAKAWPIGWPRPKSVRLRR